MKLHYEIDSKDYEDFVRELHEKLKDFEMSEGVLKESNKGLNWKII